MKMQARHFFCGLAWPAVMLLMLASPARAQSSEDPSAQQQLAAAPDSSPDQVPQPLAPPPPPQLRQAYWASIGGFEADTHHSGYGFFGPQYVKPVSSNVAWVVGANANYLYYEFPNAVGDTQVRAPGIAARGGVQFGNRNYIQLSAGPGFKVRRTEVFDPVRNLVRSTSDTVFGLDAGADVSVDPTSHNNIYGIVDYNTVDSYTWSRLAFKQQVANYSWNGSLAPFIGAEIVGQGNRDIRSTQVGAFFEVVHVPTHISVMIRGGYKRSVYDIGPAQTGPWVAVGFYQRLR
jgi:cellulose biosynthesis protein BcsS